MENVLVKIAEIFKIGNRFPKIVEFLFRNIYMVLITQLFF